jgi:hypothetical protein
MAEGFEPGGEGRGGRERREAAASRNRIAGCQRRWLDSIGALITIAKWFGCDNYLTSTGYDAA